MTTRITKTHVLAALQCAKRAWLTVHAPTSATPIAVSRRALIDAGRAIGKRAHGFFPNATLVDEADFAAARTRTAALIDDGAIATILEAAVEHDGFAIRADALERLPGGAWGLREVKSGTRVRDVHLDDLAVQCHVLRAAGLEVASVELIHVDPQYSRGAGAVDDRRLFTRVDVTAAVEARAGDVAARMQALAAELVASEPPAIAPSPHCSTPYRCEFWAHCTRDLPPDWLLHFSYLPAERWTALHAQGITRLSQLVSEDTVPPPLWRARQAVEAGRAVVTPELAGALADFGPPADYLDFETISPAVPLYPGTSPYARVPLQWSLHRRDRSGASSHHEFLAEGAADPRRMFAETLLACAGSSDRPILVYSAFESEVLDELARALPDLAPALEQTRARLRDLLPVVRAHVYHPGFRGSFSLKSVAPALIAGFGYDDLASVHDGADATVQLTRLAAGEYPADDIARLRADLLAYCARDTEALLRLHDALRALAT